VSGGETHKKMPMMSIILILNSILIKTLSNSHLLTVTALDQLSLNTIRLEELIRGLTKMANGIALSSSGLIIRSKELPLMLKSIEFMKLSMILM